MRGFFPGLLLPGLLLPGLLLVSEFLLSCNGLPTQKDIEDDLDAQLASVRGPWVGSSFGAEFLELRFTLETRGDSLGGTGWQRSGEPVDSVAVSVHGTFRRPELDLTFEGMVWAGAPGTARFHGGYITVGGILDTLRITTAAGAASVEVLLQEQ